VVLFRAYAPFPALLPFLKLILEIVFCEDVHHLNCVKMAAFQFYHQSGKQREVRWVGNNCDVVSGQKFPGEKGIVRWCDDMIQEPVLLSRKFSAKYLQIFMQSPQNITAVSGIDFGPPGQILWE
jgi:hypothetical protein